MYDPTSLTVIVFTHNLQSRGVLRARNFMHSLRHQDYDPEIILVDQSNDESYNELEKYCMEYRVTYCYKRLEEGQSWNKSACLNAGLLRAKTDYVMFSDIDNIFAPNFLLIAKKKLTPDKFLISKVRVLPPYSQTMYYDHAYYDQLLADSKPYGHFGVGNQASTRDWFMQARGYNEGMCLWGHMDHDMHHRAVALGRKIAYMQPETWILHQWHPKGKNWRQIRRNKTLGRTEGVNCNKDGFGQMTFDWVHVY